MTAVQLVACAVEVHDTQVEVSAVSLQPFASPQKPSEVNWTNFTWPANMTVSDPRLIAVKSLVVRHSTHS